MKGQVYILIAITIAIALASVANVLYFTSLPVEREQSSLTNTKEILDNIQNEIVYVIDSNVNNLPDFINFSRNYAQEKNINLTIS